MITWTDSGTGDKDLFWGYTKTMEEMEFQIKFDPEHNHVSLGTPSYGGWKGEKGFDLMLDHPFSEVTRDEVKVVFDTMRLFAQRILICRKQ